MSLEMFRKESGSELRRRVQALAVLVAAAFVLLTGRLWFLQVVEGERFLFLSEKNRVRIKKVPGTRGLVFDRKGQLLVESRPSFDVLFVPEDADDPEAVLRRVAALLKSDEQAILSLYEQSRSRAPFEEIVLGRDVEWETVVAVEANQLDLPGVSLRVRPRRSYYNGGVAAHLLGYVGEISRDQLKLYRTKGYSMGDEIGQFGLEKSWEVYLRGRSGGQQVEVDALGRRVRVLHEVEDVPGQSVHLTLDRDLQEAAWQALEGREGAIVVLSVRDGAVLALASAPAFDPNLFARGVTAEQWRALLQDPLKPLNNRAVQGQYPPGSTFKIIVGIAGLEEGVIDPNAAISDPGFYVVGNRAFRDWKEKGHGRVDFHRGLVESCDVYYYQLGQRLGPDRIAKYARLFGLGEKTGLGLDDEKAGLIPDTEWKRRRFRQPWYPGETPSLAIGQGYVTVTPLQMANLMAALANGGTLYRPWIVRKVTALDGTLIEEYGPRKIRQIPLKPETLQRVRAALRDVVNSGYGTGGRARSERITIAGKTGTAQVVEFKGAVIKSERLSYWTRDHAWFVAYAPAEEPEIAVAVLVEHGGLGGAAAAPLAKKVIEKYAESRGEGAGLKLAREPGGGHVH